MQRKFIATTSLFLLPFFLSAQQPGRHQLKGRITDAASGETLVGASVYITQLNKGAAAELDGSFLIRDIDAGTYRLKVSYLGYNTLDTTINLDQDLKINWQLHSNSRIDEVIVTGKADGESEGSAKKSEQHADNLVNIISARAIQLSPDITVGNILQRVSGVSIERSSSGEGRYAIIRGMDQRYNNTLINGIKIPSPDTKSRYVPLDIFPAEIIERIEVNKTLTPDMEGDAIGGTVNMVTKNAPEQPYLNASLATGYNQTLLNRKYDYFPVSAIQKQSPYEKNGPGYAAQPSDFTRDNLNFQKKTMLPNILGSLSIGNRFFRKRLGIMLSASYQNTNKGYSSNFNPDDYQEGGLLYIKNAYSRTYSAQSIRTGLNLKSDYRLNNNHKISLYALYCNLNEAQTRLTTDTLQPAPRTMPGTGQIWYYGRAKYQTQNIFNTTLQGDHKFFNDHLVLNWSAVYALATNRIPDWAEYEYDGGYYTDPATPGTPPYQHPNVLQPYNRSWWYNTDQDKTGYIRLSYNHKLAGIPFTLTAGGMYRSKHRDNHYDNYQLRPIADPGKSNQLWTDIYHYNWEVFNPYGSNADANNYTSDEHIAAYYAMLKFNIHQLEITGGIRSEITDQSFATNVPVTQAAKTGKIHYSDLLPSLNLKYKLSEQINLRASYFSSISRPSFFEITPYRYQGDDWNEIGNPYLKHSTASNIDFRFEYFPRANEQVLVGVFYKNIHDPIEYGFSFINKNKVYQPSNFGDATNFGFEAVYEKYIRNFGIRTNYTYTNSAITTTKILTKIESNGQVSAPFFPEEKRPLQGQSAHIANIALLYKSVKHGINAQLTWQYTGRRIVLVSPYYDFDYWQKGMSIFDLSAEKTIVKHFALFAKVQNLFNAPYTVYINQPPSNSIPVSNQVNVPAGKTLAQKDYFGQTYQLGLRYTL
ncbi:TonB-dependent receptor [Taibaiella chishuiensis]|uniref:TonB-dependent receptor n=1 Tax=Taibaiella chishuiensis TaxID=1434707 RepID=A0A2P8CZK8_9BACT|nr:TonB-dependent receptor [Taibaiella chishuiensis]PSK90418.1 TonB-dependent receptor [Taibaiella chishuiensis]